MGANLANNRNWSMNNKIQQHVSILLPASVENHFDISAYFRWIKQVFDKASLPILDTSIWNNLTSRDNDLIQKTVFTYETFALTKYFKPIKTVREWAPSMPNDTEFQCDWTKLKLKKFKQFIANFWARCQIKYQGCQPYVGTSIWMALTCCWRSST